MKQKTFKSMPESQGAPEEATPVALGVPKDDKAALVAELLKVEGVNQEMAEHMVKHGAPADSPTMQAFYRVSAITADTVIKVFKEEK